MGNSQSTDSLSSKRQDYLSWNDYFMNIAVLSSQRSKDPITQVGACIVDQSRRIIACAYNGMPLRCSDDVMPWGTNDTEPLQDKHLYVCHAEKNAILQRNTASLKGCTLYVTQFPCNKCAQIVIQSRISKVIYLEDKYSSMWEFIASRRLMKTAGVKFRQYELSVKLQTLASCTDQASLTNKASEQNPPLPQQGAKRHDYMSWSDFFMNLAFLSGQRSKDPCTQVGACIVDASNKIISCGYNGFPNGCSDDRMPWGKSSDDKLQTKYPYVCHAELNAILNNNMAQLGGCTLYVTLYPCNDCAQLIIQSGISCVYYLHHKSPNKASYKASELMLQTAGILIAKYVPAQTVQLLHKQSSSSKSMRICDKFKLF